MDFASTAAGGQLRPNVRRPRLGTDAGRRGGVGRVGRRAAFDGERLSVGDHGADRWAVAGPRIGGDGRRGRPVCGVARGTAGQAEQTADQATAAAAAYDAAFAETVPPPVVAANRSLLMALVATNLLGQNTPAISTTETQYAEMWAQDAAAMYGYAGSSASATALAPFTTPPSSTNAGGQAEPGRRGRPSTGATSPGTCRAPSRRSATLSAVPSTLSSLATPAQGLTP